MSLKRTVYRNKMKQAYKFYCEEWSRRRAKELASDALQKQLESGQTTLNASHDDISAATVPDRPRLPRRLSFAAWLKAVERMAKEERAALEAARAKTNEAQRLDAEAASKAKYEAALDEERENLAFLPDWEDK